MLDVKRKYEKLLLRKPNVVGVGVGYKYVEGRRTGEKAIVVFVSKKLPLEHLKPEEVIPQELDGVKTDVREKRFFALKATPEEKQRRVRPAKGGVSIGHYLVTAGTLGCIVKDREDGEDAILSNNHVLANSNDAKAGDPIVQPGVYDGGNVVTDKIGELKRFIPIKFEQGSSCPVARLICGSYNALAKLVGAKTRLTPIVEEYNLVDCAIARPTDSVSREVIDVGEPSGVAEPELGMPVRKSGRTTCYTEGAIDTIDLTVRVDYGYGRTALFKDQIGIEPKEGRFSAGGDSGSAIFDSGTRVVGLLFAGDETGYTVANKISNVMKLLNVEV